MALLQVETASEAARRAEQPDNPVFVIGFLTGQEVTLLPETLRILREEAPAIEITFLSLTSPQLALALMRGRGDVAFMRRETQTTGLAYKQTPDQRAPTGRVTGQSSTGGEQGNPAAGTCPRDLHRRGSGRSGGEGRDPRLCEKGRHHAEGFL
jgi:DNA-binding transcriptional LysR family regulator